MALRVRCKIWLENEDGKLVIGTGRVRILDAILQVGSMNKAAQRLKLPFRAVWGKIKSTEDRCGFKLVESTSVGTQLTKEGTELLQRYKEFKSDCKKYVDMKFAEFFGNTDFETDTGDTKKT